MKISEIMSVDLETCHAYDTLDRAAKIMWEHDCGVVPVVDDQSHVVGMLTDRDICMAAYTQGRPLPEIAVSTACSRTIRTCSPNDSVEAVEAIMGAAQVRRIPVVDDEDKLCGVVSLGDLAKSIRQPHRRAGGLSYESLASTLAAISQPPAERVSNGGARERDERARL
jgi:CBS-domain-containing membrane protein